MTRYYPTNDTRPDEVFWKSNGILTIDTFGPWDWLFRKVTWRIEGWVFSTFILLWFVRWYAGDGKIDAAQTYRLRGEDSDYTHGYVTTTTPKERFSFRLRWRKPDRERWSNQGGI